MRQIAKCVGMIAVAGALTGLASTTAFAQDVPKTDISAGYQWQRISASDCEGDGCSETLAKGLYVDVSGGITPMFSWVGQFDGSFKSDAFDENDVKFRLHTFGGGIRISKPLTSVTPFAQFLIGGMRTKFSEPGFSEPAEKAFMIDIGGGVNVPVSPKWGARVGVDYRKGFFKDEDGGAVNAIRINIGVVINLN